jgi:hypothetical protein
MRRTRLALIVTGMVLSLGVAACTGSAASPGRSAATATAAAASAAATVASGDTVVSKPLVGVNLYVNKDYSLAETKAWGARDLKYIADTLGLKAVAVAWDYNVPSPSSDTVTASSSRTPTMADLAALTAIARTYRLRVEYRVLYAIGDSDSRGQSILPKNLTAWLRSLLAAETPALKLAQRDHVSEFIVGTEMASIDQSPLWGAFFTKAAKVYRGILSYASWGGKGGFGGFFSSQRVPLPLRYYGASAYPPFNLPPTASVEQLTKAWLAFLRRDPESVLRLTAIDETGIPAVAGSYRDPYQWNGLGNAQPDLAVQANWYRAACQAAGLVHVRAIYFWSAVLSADPASAKTPLVGFEGHPATEAAIRSCP